VIAYGWLAWLLLFLAYEIPAAISEVVYARRGQRRAITLSRNVWRWFGVTEWRPYRTARRVVLAAFMLTLSSHFVFAQPEAWAIIATGSPVALVIGYAVLVEDRRKGGLAVRLTVDPREFEAALSRAQVALTDVQQASINVALRDHAEHLRADTRGGE
jgi:hypothetical protein